MLGIFFNKRSRGGSRGTPTPEKQVHNNVYFQHKPLLSDWTSAVFPERPYFGGLDQWHPCLWNCWTIKKKKKRLPSLIWNCYFFSCKNLKPHDFNVYWRLPVCIKRERAYGWQLCFFTLYDKATQKLQFAHLCSSLGGVKIWFLRSTACLLIISKNLLIDADTLQQTELWSMEFS